MTAEEYTEMWAGMDRPARSSYINALRDGKPSALQYKETIKALYYGEYGRKIGGCINCLLSAHFDIVNGKIKGLKYMEKKDTKAVKVYDLRPGVVLYDPIKKDIGKIATAANITDELAKYHLATNPGSLKHFTKYPENWKEEAVAYAKANGLPTPLRVDDTPKKAKAPKKVEEAKKAEAPAEVEASAEVDTPALTEEEKARIAETYEQTPVAKTGRPSEK